MGLRRRTLLQGAAAGTALFSLSGILGRTSASAQAEEYVIVTEQTYHEVLVLSRHDRWNGSDWIWRFAPFTPGFPNYWEDPSGVKVRDTDPWGPSVLITTSGGMAAIVPYNTEENPDTGIWDVVWDDYYEDGNPHAIEYIPGGTLVTACFKGHDGDRNGGHLHSYRKDGSGYTHTHKDDFPGAHGVLWDVSNELLWALGDRYLRWYTIPEPGVLKREDEVELEYDGLGHDLQRDYHNPDKLLVTETNAVCAFDIPSRGFDTIRKIDGVKAIVRATDGEYIWIKSDEGKQTGHSVTFSDSPDRSYEDSQFYKVRILTTKYE